jgi:hypothetical protein
MADPINFTVQPGGVPVQSVLGPVPAAGLSSAAVPLDNSSHSIQKPIVFNVPSPGMPVLDISFIDFLLTITDAIAKHKEAGQKQADVEVKISAKAYANFITGADALSSQIDALLAEAKAESKEVDLIQSQIKDAYGYFTEAVNKYNNSMGTLQANDAAAISAINAKLALLNSYQGLAKADYDALIKANGGEGAVSGDINGAINTWNSYVGGRNPQVVTLQGNLQAEIGGWGTAINTANAKLEAINTKRAARNLPPVSLYPDVSTTYTVAFPPPLTTISNISGNVGPDRTPPIAFKINSPSGLITVVTLESLALTGAPSASEVTTSAAYTALVAVFAVVRSIAEFFALIFAAVFQDFTDPSLKGKKSLLPAAYIDKVDPLYLNTEGSGTGLGQVGRPEFDRVVPAALLKSIFEKAKFPASNKLLTSFQLASLGILDKSSLAAAIPAATAFGNKLGSISELSPTFGAVLASAIADNTLATTAAAPARELANIVLKNVIGAASAAGITFGDLGNPSAGEIAQISGSLSAAFNVNLLGTTLAMFQKTLGFPDLALQVIGNTEGLSASDAIRAAIGGAKFNDVLSDPLSVVFLKQSLADSLVLQSGYSSNAAAVIANAAVNGAGSNVQTEQEVKQNLEQALVNQGLSKLDAALQAQQLTEFIKADVGIPTLNNPPPDTINATKAASELLDTVLGINNAQEETKNRIIQQFVTNREKIAAIIKESIQSAIRSGKLDISRELRNEVVAGLRSGGFELKQSLYLANQLINQLTGNPLSPITGITADRLEQLKDADKGITQSAISEAINSGPFSSEIAFTNALRGILDRSSGGGAALDNALASLSNIKILNIEELHKTLSEHLDNLLTGLGAANAREARDKILIALLGGATPKEVVDVEKRNPISLINQISEQKARISKDAKKEDEEKIHERFLEVMQAFMIPNAILGNAITSMQDKPTTVLNSISGAVQAVAQTDVLQGPV